MRGRKAGYRGFRWLSNRKGIRGDNTAQVKKLGEGARFGMRGRGDFVVAAGFGAYSGVKWRVVRAVAEWLADDFLAP